MVRKFDLLLALKNHNGLLQIFENTLLLVLGGILQSIDDFDFLKLVDNTSKFVKLQIIKRHNYVAINSKDELCSNYVDDHKNDLSLGFDDAESKDLV